MSKYNVPKIEELIAAGAHFGHQIKRWHPEMEPYIYTAAKNIHIIDLEKSVELLKEAADFLYEVAKYGGKIVFVGTKKQAREVVEIEAGNCGAMYVTERWLGGTFTNIDVIKKNNIDKLLNLKSRKEKGELQKYTKKERLLIDREIERLERYVGGLTNLKKLPEALFVIDARREKTAVKEAKKANIPVVALVDTNTNPRNIDYLIPANDDAIKSISVFTKVISDAISAGYEEYSKTIKKEVEKKTEDVKVIKKMEQKKEDSVKSESVGKKETADKVKEEKESKISEPEKTEKAPEKETKKSENKESIEKPKKKRGRPKKDSK